MRKVITVTAATVLLVGMMAVPGGAEHGEAFNITWEGHGRDSVACGDLPEHGIEAGDPYIHWVLTPPTAGDVITGGSVEMTWAGGSDSVDLEPSGEDDKGAWQGWHVGDFDIDSLEAHAGVSAENEPGKLVISDFCPGVPDEEVEEDENGAPDDENGPPDDENGPPDDVNGPPDDVNGAPEDEDVAVEDEAFGVGGGDIDDEVAVLGLILAADDEEPVVGRAVDERAELPVTGSHLLWLVAIALVMVGSGARLLRWT